MRKLLVLAVLLVLFSPAVAMAGTDIDVAGIWDLQAETPVPNQGAQGEGEVPPICLFEGTAQVSQDGTSLTGNAALALADGPVECPMELSASFTGNVSATIHRTDKPKQNAAKSPTICAARSAGTSRRLSPRLLRIGVQNDVASTSRTLP